MIDGVIGKAQPPYGICERDTSPPTFQNLRTKCIRPGPHTFLTVIFSLGLMCNFRGAVFSGALLKDPYRCKKKYR